MIIKHPEAGRAALHLRSNLRAFQGGSWGLGLLAAAALTPASATDGYFSNGYGIKAKGRAGKITLAQLQAANSGANLDRLRTGQKLFIPIPEK